MIMLTHGTYELEATPVEWPASKAFAKRPAPKGENSGTPSGATIAHVYEDYVQRLLDTETE